MADPKHPIDPQKEIEIQIGELEERVDRLRAIYEQYFMGYEKLEPTVPRKDVDRRFVVLRKANIRNTALRFRFNVVTQKFNTYSMYWTRICRQIEEGTFKRHIQKANRRFGGARNRMEDLSIDVDLGDFEVEMDDEPDLDAIFAEASAAVEAPRSGRGAPREPSQPPSHGLGGLDHDTLPPTSAPPASIAPAAAAGQPRVARPAALPAGAKGRVLLKKSAGGPPGQPQPAARADGARPRMPSVTDEAAPRPRLPSFTDEAPSSARGRMPPLPEGAPPSARPRMPSVPDAPSTSVIRAASPHVHRSPPGVNRPAISPNAQSVRRVQVAAPAAPDGQAPPPAATPQGYRPAVRPRGDAAPAQRPPTGGPAPSVGRIPAAAAGAGPAIPPPAARPAPASTRMPVGLPSSVSRVPAAPPEAVAPPPAAGPPSERRPPVQQSAPMPPPPPVRPRAPSTPDLEGGPRSRRPPPPLPSQIKKG